MLMGDRNGMAMLKTEVFSSLIGQVVEGLAVK